MTTASMTQSTSPASLQGMRDALEQAERLMVRLDRTNIQQFLLQMDAIEQMWPEFGEPSGLPAEEGRWQSLLKRIATNPKLVNGAASQAGGLTKLRSQHLPATGSWWHVDQQAAGQRNKMFQRVGVIVGVVVLALVAFWVVNFVMSRGTVTTEVAASVTDAVPKIEQLVEQERWQAALTVVESALKSSPDDAALLAWDSVLAAQLGDSTRAEASLAQAETKFVGEPFAFWMMVGENRLKAGDWDGADEAAQQALILTPEDARVVFLLGRVAEARGDLANANEYYDQALTLAGESNLELVALIKLRMGYLMQGVGPLPSPAPLPETTGTATP
jgi:tetratricopeptide (TPR) repeat protein